MELSQIYSPINEDLIKVEANIKEIGHVDFPWLAELLSQSISAGGKRIRPALTLLCGKFYNYRFEPLTYMATSIELMHTATLIHDDAIDKSMIRRGKSAGLPTSCSLLIGTMILRKRNMPIQRS